MPIPVNSTGLIFNTLKGKASAWTLLDNNGRLFLIIDSDTPSDDNPTLPEREFLSLLQYVLTHDELKLGDPRLDFVQQAYQRRINVVDRGQENPEMVLEGANEVITVKINSQWRNVTFVISAGRRMNIVMTSFLDLAKLFFIAPSIKGGKNDLSRKFLANLAETQITVKIPE